MAKISWFVGVRDEESTVRESFVYIYTRYVCRYISMYVVDYAKVDNFLCCSWIGLPPRDKYNSIDGGCGSNRAAMSCIGYISCLRLILYICLRSSNIIAVLTGPGV